MTVPKVWQFIIGMACMVCLLLTRGGAASQTDIIDDIYSIAWRPDGLQVATGHALGTVRLWDATTEELLNTFHAPGQDFGFPPQIDDVEWHPDGTKLAVTASAATDPIAFLWVLDAATGEVLHNLEAGVMGHDAAWSPDGTLLASAIIREFGAPMAGIPGEAGVNVWDVETEQLIAEFDTDDVIFTVAWSPDGRRLASIGWVQTTIWDTQTWTALVQMGEPSHMPTTLWVAWSPDGTRVVTPGSDGLAYIWDATTGELLMTLQSGDKDQLHQIEWQPGGNLLVGRSDHALIYWNAATGQQVARMETSEWIGNVAWSPDGTQLLYSNDSTESPQFAVIPVSLPDFEPLSACWMRDWNQAQTEWHIDNPNPVPLSTNPEVKVRYNWTVYDAFDAQGSVVQSASGWDNANPNPLNTPLAKSLHLAWYLVIDGEETDILGETVVNADESGQCPGPPTGSGTGLQGEYFDKKDFTRLALTRIDPTVDFDWGKDAPAPEVQKNSFSVRWSGQVEPLYSETYTFYTVSDDGIRLWVDDQPVIDNWNNHSAREDSGTIALAEGQRYDIRVDYYENGGEAVARLLWSSPSQSKAVIPQSQLYPPAP